MINLIVRIGNRCRFTLEKYLLKLRYGRKINIGKVFWRPRFSVVIDNGHIEIGDFCFFNFDCSITSLGCIKIGSHNLFGENVKIYDHNHRFYLRNEYVSKQGMSVGKVVIGSNCWIGSNVVILNNTIIGDNCVIGAGCVVSGKIPNGTMLKASGNYTFEDIRYR